MSCMMAPLGDHPKLTYSNHFLALPEEVRIRILRELSAIDLLACQKVRWRVSGLRTTIDV